MAFLKRRTAAGDAPIVTAALVLTVVAGCTLVETLLPPAPPFAFSHRLHVGSAGLACLDCHAPVAGDAEPGWPGPEACARCHAEEESVPPERRVSSLFDGDAYRAARAGAQSGEILFSHRAHAAAAPDCRACHAEVAEDDGLLATRRTELRMSMDACLACHGAGAPAEADCAACHAEIRAERSPPSHDLGWMRTHGLVARARSSERLDRCAQCHGPSSCDACHQTQLPASHDNFWRRRGHGLTASLDRSNCAACHEPDACQRCHEETRPQNHTGSFGAPRDRHCLSCHEPLRSTSCGVCHADTPSHELATPLPADHVPSMNCRLCHGNGQPLPHADNGQTCTACHR